MKKLLVLLSLVPLMLIFSSYAPSKKAYDEDARIKIAHNIVANLAKGDFQGVKADFDQSLDAALSTDKLSDGWKSLTGQVGDYKSTLSTSTSTVQNYNQVKVRCKFDKGEATVEVTYSGNDKVIGLYLRP